MLSFDLAGFFFRFVHLIVAPQFSKSRSPLMTWSKEPNIQYILGFSLGMLSLFLSFFFINRKSVRGKSFGMRGDNRHIKQDLLKWLACGE